MKNLVYIRADGNSSTGLGHLYRCFALFEMLKGMFDCVFVTRASSIVEIIPTAYKTLIIPSEIELLQETSWLKEYGGTSNGLIIADGYHFTSEYQKNIKDAGFNLIYIDDLATTYFYADAVINHAPTISLAQIDKQPYTTMYIGTKYAMLRPSFLKEAAKAKEIVEEISSVFVCFGGADALDLSFKAVSALVTFPQLEKIHVVVGAGYKNTAIYELAEEHGKMVVHKNIAEQKMIAVMQSCQFAIAPASTIVYELCCIKMPILGGYYVANQREIYEGLIEYQVIIEGGNFEDYGVEDFRSILERSFRKDTTPYIRNQSKLFDEAIKYRITSIVSTLTKKFEIREATNDDMGLFFEWANEPLTRAMSFSSEPIPLENHKKWFANQLVSNDAHLLVLEVVIDGIHVSVGNVKFDNKGIIGVSLDVKYRGKGMGAFLINQGLQWIANNQTYPCIFAYIKDENKKSRTIFEQAGFVFSKETTVQNVPCLEFTYKLSTT